MRALCNCADCFGRCGVSSLGQRTDSEDPFFFGKTCKYPENLGLIKEKKEKRRKGGGRGGLLIREVVQFIIQSKAVLFRTMYLLSHRCGVRFLFPPIYFGSVAETIVINLW